jgi:hypothetical protein
VGRGRDPRTLVDLARAAEAAGWDGFFLADNLVADGGAPVLDTQSILAAIAGQTRRIGRGPLITARAASRAGLRGRRSPWIIWRAAAEPGRRRRSRAGVPHLWTSPEKVDTLTSLIHHREDA